MACDTVLRENQTIAQRAREITESLARLERYLKTGSVRVTIGSQGSVAFTGWKDRDDISDVCAYRTMTLANNWTLKQAVARAEMLCGRKVNLQSVAAGWHTHDGTQWSKH